MSAPVTGSTLRYEPAGDAVSTTLTYATTGGDTAIARLPHQGVPDGCKLGSYPSVYGPLTLCPGSSLTWTTPRAEASGQLDLADLSADQVSRLTTQLDADIAALPPFPPTPISAARHSSAPRCC